MKFGCVYLFGSIVGFYGFGIYICDVLCWCLVFLGWGRGH